MSEWGFWEWLTYGCIAVAAVILALDAAVKQSTELSFRFSRIRSSRIWAFTPFVLILLSAVLIAFRILGSLGPPTSGIAASPISVHGESSTRGSDNSRGANERLFVAFGPEYLFAHLKDHTAAERAALFGLYQYKWMKIQGSVGTISERQPPDKGVVAFIVTSKSMSVDCWFDENQSVTSSTLQTGTSVSAIGQIVLQPFSDDSLLLQHCELLSFGPHP